MTRAKFSYWAAPVFAVVIVIRRLHGRLAVIIVNNQHCMCTSLLRVPRLVRELACPAIALYNATLPMSAPFVFPAFPVHAL